MEKLHEFAKEVDKFILNRATILAEEAMRESNSYYEAKIYLKRRRPIGTDKNEKILYERAVEYISQQAEEQAINHE